MDLSSVKKELRVALPIAAAAVAGVALKTLEQPNEIAFVAAVASAAAMYQFSGNMFARKTQGSRPVQEEFVADSSSEEEEVVVKKPTKKPKRSRYAGKKKAKEDNKEEIEAARAAKEKARQQELARIAAEKQAEEDAAAAAAAAAAAESKSKKKKKGKKKKPKHVEQVIEPVEPEPEPEPEIKEEDLGWSTVEETRKPKDPVAADEAKQTEVTVQFKCDSKYYGQIIGKGGEILKLIQDNSGANINMPKKGGMMHDLITITGQPECVQLAKDTIASLVKTGYSTMTHPDFEADTIDVPRKQHGLVMGKAGANIRAIQRTTNTKINMPGKGEGNLVTIVGEAGDIRAAKQAIRDLVDQGYSENTHPGWVKREVPFPSELVNHLIGKSGATIRLLQKRYGCEISTPAPSAIHSVVTILGPEGQVGKCELEVRNLAVVDDAVVEKCWGGEAAGYDLASLTQW